MSPVLKHAMQHSTRHAQTFQRGLDVLHGHLQRDGFCVCGLAVALHYNERNAFVGCLGALLIVTHQDRLLELPVVLTLSDMSRLLDRSQRAIREDVQHGTFPIPHLDQYPRLLWHRKDVLTWLGHTTFAPLRTDDQTERLA